VSKLRRTGTAERARRTGKTAKSTKTEMVKKNTLMKASELGSYKVFDDMSGTLMFLD